MASLKLPNMIGPGGELPLFPLQLPTHLTPRGNLPPSGAHTVTPAPAGQIQEKDLFKLFPACISLQTLLLIKAAPQSFS